MVKPLRRHKTVAQALEWVARNPDYPQDPIDMPAWQLIGYALFDIANKPDRKVRGALARATRAQKIILDRMVGLRAPGSKPVETTDDSISFVDLTSHGVTDGR